MCFTVDQIDRACGLLLLNEFNSFIYCCKQCTCEFESGSSLEMHILSEHQDDKETVFGNDGVSVDTFEPAPVEYVATNVKTEQFESNADDLDELNIEEQIVDDVKPMNGNFNNGNINTEENRAENKISFEEISIGIKELEDKNDTVENVSQNTLKMSIPKERSRGRPPGAKNKKKTDDKPVKKSIPKQGRGRKLGSKNEYKQTVGTFYCDMCPDLMFKQKHSLIKHIIVRHINAERNMKRCEICNKFPRKSYEHHMKIKHSIQNQYKCDFCDSTFKHNETRIVHMRTHSGEKPFLCSHCGKAFISKSTCYTHETYVHNNVRNYQCPHCDKAFRQQCILQDHINAIHTKKRPHVCDICGKGFAAMNTLRLHKAVHTGKKLKCRYCDVMFTVGTSRWKHEKVFHKKNLCKNSNRMKMNISEEKAQQ